MQGDTRRDRTVRPYVASAVVDELLMPHELHTARFAFAHRLRERRGYRRRGKFPAGHACRLEQPLLEPIEPFQIALDHLPDRARRFDVGAVEYRPALG